MRHITLIIGLAGFVLLGACQSSDISFLEPATPQSRTAAQNQQQNPITAQGEAASGPPRSLENPNPGEQDQTAQTDQTAETTAQGEHETAQTPQHQQQEPATDTPGRTASAGSTGATQGSLSQAAGVNASGAQDDETRRVELGSEGSGLASDVRQEMTELLGGTDNVRVKESLVKEEVVVGNWNLAEEDGLRSCTIAFTSSEKGSGVQVTPGCSDDIAAIRGWGVFGEDLLLHDSDNSVIVRLRQSGGGWVGFTLASGIPIILSR